MERAGEFNDAVELGYGDVLAQNVQVVAVEKLVHPGENMPLLPGLGNNYCLVFYKDGAPTRASARKSFCRLENNLRFFSGLEHR